jgi:hypothetical protein
VCATTFQFEHLYCCCCFAGQSIQFSVNLISVMRATSMDECVRQLLTVLDTMIDKKQINVENSAVVKLCEMRIQRLVSAVAK